MRTPFRIFLLVVCLVLAGPVNAQVAQNPVNNIVVLGDSLSAGYAIAESQSWPSLLQQRLDRQNHQYKVINASISGETTTGGLARINRILSTHKPAIVLLQLGANDGLRGLPVTQMEFNLSSIVERCLAQNAKVLLIGMQIPPNYGFDYTQKFRDTYASVAKIHRVGLVPFLLDGVSERRELMQRDNLHPRANAQPLLLDNIWPHLQKLL